jgi:hypothetical protein
VVPKAKTIQDSLAAVHMQKWKVATGLSWQ